MKLFLKVNKRIINLDQVIDIDFQGGNRVQITTTGIYDGMSMTHSFEGDEATVVKDAFKQFGDGLIRFEE